MSPPVTPPAVTPDGGGGGDGQVTPDDSGLHDCADCSTTLAYWLDQLKRAQDKHERYVAGLKECLGNIKSVEEFVEEKCGPKPKPPCDGCPIPWPWRNCQEFNEEYIYPKYKKKYDDQCREYWNWFIDAAQSQITHHQFQVDRFNDPDHWCNRNCKGWRDDEPKPKPEKNPTKPVDSKTPAPAVDPKSVFGGGNQHSG